MGVEFYGKDTLTVRADADWTLSLQIAYKALWSSLNGSKGSSTTSLRTILQIDPKGKNAPSRSGILLARYMLWQDPQISSPWFQRITGRLATWQRCPCSENQWTQTKSVLVLLTENKKTAFEIIGSSPAQRREDSDVRIRAKRIAAVTFVKCICQGSLS